MINDVIFSDFDHVDLSDLTMPAITVYFNPADYKDKYVARIGDMLATPPGGSKKVYGSTNFVMVKDSLEEIRKEIPNRFVKFQKSVDDDACIVEVYI